jgi:putative hydroxymethylpyrimidine transport system permease protein
VLLPLLIVGALLVAWEAAVRAFDIIPQLLPPPSSIVARIVRQPELFVEATATTLVNMIVGLVVGVAVGIGAGLAIFYSPFLRRVLYPIVVTSQTIPAFALAPLLVLWFGFGPAPKVILIVLWVFFPVSVSLVTGLGSADPEAIALMRSYRASGRQIFRFVQFPASLPYLFAGLQIAVTYSVIAAVFSELVGAVKGLGRLMVTGNFQRNIDLTMAAILITSVIALVGYLLVWLLARRSMPWRQAGRT